MIYHPDPTKDIQVEKIKIHLKLTLHDISNYYSKRGDMLPTVHLDTFMILITAFTTIVDRFSKIKTKDIGKKVKIKVRCVIDEHSGKTRLLRGRDAAYEELLQDRLFTFMIYNRNFRNQIKDYMEVLNMHREISDIIEVDSPMFDKVDKIIYNYVPISELIRITENGDSPEPFLPCLIGINTFEFEFEDMETDVIDGVLNLIRIYFSEILTLL